jgi:hypothetical protein
MNKNWQKWHLTEEFLTGIYLHSPIFWGNEYFTHFWQLTPSRKVNKKQVRGKRIFFGDTGRIVGDFSVILFHLKEKWNVLSKWQKISDNSPCVAKKYTLSPEHFFVHFSRMVVNCQNLIWQTSKKWKVFVTPENRRV